jgi:hypothetical protein
MLGGKCQRCGFDGHPSALEFHHVGEKDFNISLVANKSWASIVEEVKKCELICSNCHRIEHSERYNADFIEMALEYAGYESFGGWFKAALDRGALKKLLRKP